MPFGLWMRHMKKRCIYGLFHNGTLAVYMPIHEVTLRKFFGCHRNEILSGPFQTNIA